MINLIYALQQHQKYIKYNQLDLYFTDTGKLARSLYPKHIEFFELGATKRQRMFRAGNRVGKTIAIAYELTLHLTGLYLWWWTGKRFNKPLTVWVLGISAKEVRNVMQRKLVGSYVEIGTGLIPRKHILKFTAKAGVPEAIDTLYVKSVDGHISKVVFKSYDQGRENMQGDEVDILLFDEEPPQPIYEECCIRTTTTKGITMIAMTPLQGQTAMNAAFDQDTIEDGKYKIVVNCGVYDVPHLSADDISHMKATTHPSQWEARSLGIASLGAGAVYPVRLQDIIEDTYPIPDHWRRCYALDVGFVSKTACLWAAIDDNGVMHLYDEYYVSRTEPPIVASAIKARGAWMKGACDYAGTNQEDGRRLINIYRDECGLDVIPANKSIEAGINKGWIAMTNGKLKVQRHLVNWIKEFNGYYKDEKGKFTGANHLMDCTRYVVMSHEKIARTNPSRIVAETPHVNYNQHRDSWLTR